MPIINNVNVFDRSHDKAAYAAMADYNTQHRSVTLNNGINIIIPLVPGVPYTIDSKDLQDPVTATYSGPDHAHNNEPIFLLK
jgi:hypothetical protein